MAMRTLKVKDIERLENTSTVVPLGTVDCDCGPPSVYGRCPSNLCLVCSVACPQCCDTDTRATVL
jgi:hypothetical protein